MWLTMGPVKGSCEQGKEFSSFRKRREFLGKLNEYHFLKNTASFGLGNTTDAQHL
jgi:hypothetical protein